MTYFFPSLVDKIRFSDCISENFGYTINSGENAIRVLLRISGLKEGEKVAIPAFVCDAVKRAVIKEKLVPVYFDLKSDDTFFTDYDLEIVADKKIKAIVIAHLYGFMHPDIEKIFEFCKENNISVIHDAAQSYGINEDYLLSKGHGIVYSFGPGKSTTGAIGGAVKGIDERIYLEHVKDIKRYTFLCWLVNQKAELFLKSRMINYCPSIMDSIKFKFVGKLSKKWLGQDRIFSMTDYQCQAADYAIKRMRECSTERKSRHALIAGAISDSDLLSLAYDDGAGQYFKAIIYVKSPVEEFLDYLKSQKIPNFSMFTKYDSMRDEFKGLKSFVKNASRFIEISTEAVIPWNEIERIANTLKSYK